MGDHADLIARLRAEDARMQTLFDLTSTYRDRAEKPGAFTDFNNLRHAISGRDPVLEPAADALAALVARVAKLEARLEITHCGRLVDGKLVRVEIPPEERDKFPDAVFCRDASIALRDEEIEELIAERDVARAAGRREAFAEAADDPARTRLIYDWIRDDLGLAAKMTITALHVRLLCDRIAAAIRALAGKETT